MSNALIGWSKRKELMLQTKSWTIFGQYPSTWSVENCGSGIGGDISERTAGF